MEKAFVATSMGLTPAGVGNEVEAREKTAVLGHGVAVEAAKREKPVRNNGPPWQGH